MKKKLVHVTTVPLALRFLTGHIGYMNSHGFEVHALSSPGPLLEQYANQVDVVVHGVRMSRRITPLQDVVALIKIWYVLRCIKPLIVHAHTPKGGLLGMVAAWMARVPVRVYHIHGLPLTTAVGRKRTLLRLSDKLACTLAQRVYCVSPSIRDVALAEGLCPPSKATVLGAGSIGGVDAAGRFHPERVDLRDRAGLRQNYGIPTNALVIGFLGRVVRDKGIGELVEAWQLLRSSYPDLHLLIAGLFEIEDPLQDDIITTLRTDPRVHLVPFTDDVPSILACIDILALPTYREGFGVVAIEAAAMELPVVATKIPGCIDAVQDGVTGLLIPARDAPALAYALQQYLDAPELRQQHGRAGRARVIRDFVPSELWTAMYDEYTRLLASARYDVNRSMNYQNDKRM